MTKILIIGAGIIGLSIAYEFSKKKRDFKIFVLEKNKKFGSGNSSQSSEVIHSGVYYKKNSLKKSSTSLLFSNIPSGSGTPAAEVRFKIKYRGNAKSICDA